MEPQRVAAYTASSSWLGSSRGRGRWSSRRACRTRNGWASRVTAADSSGARRRIADPERMPARPCDQLLHRLRVCRGGGGGRSAAEAGRASGREGDARPLAPYLTHLGDEPRPSRRRLHPLARLVRDARDWTPSVTATLSRGAKMQETQPVRIRGDPLDQVPEMRRKWRLIHDTTSRWSAIRSQGYGSRGARSTRKPRCAPGAPVSRGRRGSSLISAATSEIRDAGHGKDRSEAKLPADLPARPMIATANAPTPIRSARSAARRTRSAARNRFEEMMFKRILGRQPR